MVRRHLVEDPRDLELIEGLHELQQRLVVELGEDLARALRGEQPEHRHLRLERQLAQQRRDVGGMRRREQVDEPAAVAALEQRLNGLHAPRGLFHPAYCPRLHNGDRARSACGDDPGEHAAPVSAVGRLRVVEGEGGLGARLRLGATVRGQHPRGGGCFGRRRHRRL